MWLTNGEEVVVLGLDVGDQLVVRHYHCKQHILGGGREGGSGGRGEGAEEGGGGGGRLITSCLIRPRDHTRIQYFP